MRPVKAFLDLPRKKRLAVLAMIPGFLLIGLILVAVMAAGGWKVLLVGAFVGIVMLFFWGLETLNDR